MAAASEGVQNPAYTLAQLYENFSSVHEAGLFKFQKGNEPKLYDRKLNGPTKNKFLVKEG